MSHREREPTVSVYPRCPWLYLHLYWSLPSLQQGVMSSSSKPHSQGPVPGSPTCSPCSTQTAYAAAVVQLILQLWNERRSYRVLGAVERAVQHMENLLIDAEARSACRHCPACAAEKWHRYQFPNSSSRTSRPFEMVHTGLSGPARVPAPLVSCIISPLQMISPAGAGSSYSLTSVRNTS